MTGGSIDLDAWEKWREFTTEAYGRFHSELVLRPAQPKFASYASVERARNANGNFPWSWGVPGEIQECINSANSWALRLHEWTAWNLVVNSYEAYEDKWDVLRHFVEPIAFFCMNQPSSLLDRLSLTVENLLHQGNLRVWPQTVDALDQDKLKPGQTLRRSDRRKQLDRLGKSWAAYGPLREALASLDGANYRIATQNFRDLSAHSFAPRLMSGKIARSIRSIVPIQRMVLQGDGTYLPVEDLSCIGVNYEMRVIDPLPLDLMHLANSGEYGKLTTALLALAALVDEICDRIGPAQ